MPKPRLTESQGRPIPQFAPTLSPLEGALGQRLEVAPAPRKALPSPVPKESLIIVPERIRPHDLLNPANWYCRYYCTPKPSYRVRKNQKNLSATEWARFISAIETLAMPGMPSPNYQDFVDIHDQAMTTMAGMSWGAHTMGPPPDDGRNFVTWHREYLAKLEARLMTINPLVTIPYWDWTHERAIPPALTNPADLAEWGIIRGTFNAAALPTVAQINAVESSGITPPDFQVFQRNLELAHNPVHGAVGGTMGGSRSPADPLFWLHHAFIDKLWANWEQANPGAAFAPPNGTETLQPPPIETRKVTQVVSITALGYVYG